MGFSKPKAVTPEPAPPPVTTTGEDVARAEMDQRRAQKRRDGYANTLLTRNDAPRQGAAKPKKTLLG